MKKLLVLFGLYGLLLSGNSFAQDTLYYENYETANSWTMNTTDMSSVGSSGVNFFVVNNNYTGGSGTLICLSFPFSYTIVNTPQQPSGITNFPTSKYMHTMSIYGQADNIFCSSFAAADGFCIMPENIFTKMTNDINTTNYTGVSTSFWWTCGGGTAIYGELYYSTDGGTTWVQQSTPIAQYKNQTGWVQQTISNAAWDGQATLRFGWRFVNQTSSSAIDPGMSIDDVTIKGNPTVAATIATTGISANTFCGGDSIYVDYTATGSYNSGNVFTAQLSDAAGSFAAPVTIGSITSQVSGYVPAVIPALTPAGSGYRTRVVSSNPAVTGSDNGSDFTVNAMASTGTLTVQSDSICIGEDDTLSLASVIGSVAWLGSTDGIAYSYLAGQTNPMMNAGMWVTEGDNYFMAVATNGCGEDTVITMVYAESATADFSFLINGMQVDFTDLSTNPFSWSWDFGDGNTDNTQNPSHTYTSNGTYVVTLTVTSPLLGCTDVFIDTIMVSVGIENSLPGISLTTFPNPFHSSIQISLNGTDLSSMEMAVFDQTGRKVAQLFNGEPAGNELKLVWEPGADLSGGVYYLRIKTETGQSDHKLIYLK